jgi:hypothetical protein
MHQAGGRLSLVVLAAALVVLVGGPTAGAESDKKADYIVVLKDVPSAAAVAGEHAEKLKGTLKHVYEDALKGYAIELNESQLEKLAADPRVDYVEPDQPVQAETTQTGATWGSTGSTSGTGRSAGRSRTRARARGSGRT